MRAKRTGLACALAAALLLAVGGHAARAAEIDPEAEQVLRRMSDHLAGLRSFGVETEASTELMLKTGQKVQLNARGSGVFDRERGFRFRRTGSIADLEVVFDGRNLTLYAGQINGYRTIEVEGGNDAALDEFRHAFGVEAAGGVDLLYADPYEGLLYEASEGHYFGETWIGDIRAHHLGFRAADVDWQIWIRAEGDPLPLKYVITSKWVTGAPSFTTQIRAWNLDVAVAEADVAFTPPEGAMALDPAQLDALGVALTE